MKKLFILAALAVTGCAPHYSPETVTYNGFPDRDRIYLASFQRDGTPPRAFIHGYPPTELRYLRSECKTGLAHFIVEGDK